MKEQSLTAVHNTSLGARTATLWSVHPSPTLSQHDECCLINNTWHHNSMPMGQHLQGLSPNICCSNTFLQEPSLPSPFLPITREKQHPALTSSAPVLTALFQSLPKFHPVEGGNFFFIQSDISQTRLLWEGPGEQNSPKGQVSKTPEGLLT